MSLVFLAQTSPDLPGDCQKRAERALRHEALPVQWVHPSDTGFLAVGAPQADVLQTGVSEEGTAMILGYALDEEGHALTPQALMARWGQEPSFQPDGFFLAAVMRPDGSLSVAVDPLGLYPAFYTALPDGRWIVASAAGDLAIHPSFRKAPDPEGISGLLLLNNPLDDRTVLRNVRQIPIRTVVTLSKGKPAVFHTAPLPEPDHPESFEQALELFSSHWSRVIRQHSSLAGTLDCDVLLSGGRDSRMAAFSVKKAGFSLRPVTFGLRGEYEVIAARAVNRQMRLRKGLLFRDDDPRLCLKAWQTRALRSGGHGGGSFGALIPQAGLRPWLQHGILLDDLLGGYATRFSWDPDSQKHDGKLFFDKLNRWGLPEETVSGLFRDQEEGAWAGQLKLRMLRDFAERTGEEGTASFDWKFRTRCRHHLGASLWEFSRYTWPTVPACDQKLFSFFRSLPLEWVNNRALQTAWMHRNCPELLRIPFEDNTHRFAGELFSRRWPAWRKRLFANEQPLRYHRVFSMQSPGWRAVSREAEAAREALFAFLEPDKLESVWPKDVADRPYPNPFAALAGVRSLMVLAGYFSQEDAG